MGVRVLNLKGLMHKRVRPGLKRAVHDQLYAYLTNADLLSNAQSGFRSNHSTSTTLHDVQDYILNNMDDGYATGVIFLDLKTRLIP